MTKATELDELVGAAISNGTDFYREFSSRFFGALIGEMSIAKFNNKDSLKSDEILKIAEEVYQNSKKAANSRKVTA